MSEESKRTLKNWAHLRFSIVGPLLARPPDKGDLAKSSKNWPPAAILIQAVKGSGSVSEFPPSSAGITRLWEPMTPSRP